MTYIWNAFSNKFELLPQVFTYHSFTDNWYLTLPLTWCGTVKTTNTNMGIGFKKVDFYTSEEVTSDEELHIEAPLFTVYVLTGPDREAFASQEGKFVISKREDIIFAGEIKSPSYLGVAINEDMIKSAFSNRGRDWTSEIIHE